ncbi:MFS transporter [Hyphococcus formosus]|uniref:MFS transporter n=1 Tax=Hyphococcus formosus TaxID=3143534 RepID=UPI00398B6C47
MSNSELNQVTERDSAGGASIVGFVRKWAGFSIVSFFFFLVTAGTFTSLGVVLPHMIGELGWNYSQAGVGFSLLALLVGLAAMVPAWIIRRWGIKTSFAVGGACLAIGFALLATATTLMQYFLGASFAGFGYTLCAIVPAVHYFNAKVDAKRRAAVIGAYLTVGGLGGVVGPLLATGVVELLGDWRFHWWVLASVTVVMTLLAVSFVDDNKSAAVLAEVETAKSGEAGADAPYEWSFRQVLRTKEYYIIVFSMTLTLVCGLTMNSWAVAHMGALGVSGAIAAGALSMHALVNSFSRGIGGLLANRIDPKWLLVSALFAEIIGMLALSSADNSFMIGLFAIAEGYGFGMCLFATTLLLVNYYGTANNPEVQGSMHFITTLAMVGPAAAGLVADKIGTFSVVFVAYAVMLLGVLVAAITMRKPKPPVSTGAAGSSFIASDLQPSAE